MKGYILLAIFATASFSSIAQRVVRKGTRPMQLTPPGSKKEEIKKQFFTLAQVQGKWQEHGRTPVGGGDKLAYTDTLMINISKTNAEVREGMSMNMKGDAAIEDGDHLVAAGDEYIIRSVGNGKMVLDDGEFVHTMELVKKFYLETVGKDSVMHTSMEVPRSIQLANVSGKWVVYRREAKPGVITKETELVKSISILKDSTDRIAKGEIVIYSNDVSEKMSCIITLSNNNMQIVSGKRSWNFDTYLADNNEFVFGKSDQVMHYAKRL